MLQGKRKLVGFLVALLAVGLMAWLGAEDGWGWVVVGLYGAFAGANAVTKITGGKSPVLELAKAGAEDEEAA